MSSVGPFLWKETEFLWIRYIAFSHAGFVLPPLGGQVLQSGKVAVRLKSLPKSIFFSLGTLNRTAMLMLAHPQLSSCTLNKSFYRHTSLHVLASRLSV